MFGSLLNIIAQQMRAMPSAKSYDLNVVTSVNDGSATINTPLPCVVLSIQDSTDANVAIGGLITDKVELQIAVIVDFDNPTLTNDKSHQEKMLNLPYLVRDYFETIKRGSAFTEPKMQYDYFALYKGFVTYQTKAFTNETEKSVAVYEFKYECTITSSALFNTTNPSETTSAVLLQDKTDNRTDREQEITKYYLFLADINSLRLITNENKELTVYGTVQS